MITEPEINKSLLRDTLENEFGFSVEEISFNLKGEASWSYILQTNKGKFFLKIYKPENFNPKVFDFTYRLYDECKIENLVHPLKTKGYLVFCTFENYKLVLFNFIDGKTIREQPLTNDQLEQLGELLAKIHKSTEIIGQFSIQEKFDIPFKQNILKIYKTLNSFDNLNEFKEKAKQIYIQYEDTFFGELKSLEKLAEKLKNQKVEFVNCHGEPSPGNIMISTEGKIYLIDWDFPIYAPKEKDLMFFDEKLEPVLAGYRKMYPEAEINQEVRKYYGLLWNVQEIEDWGKRLLLENHLEDENKHNLDELLHFLNYSGLKI